MLMETQPAVASLMGAWQVQRTGFTMGAVSQPLPATA